MYCKGRKTVLLWMLALLALFSACQRKTNPSGAQTSAKPNVLFISIDDLNDWISPLGGHPGVKTPNLDRLAAYSTVFEKAYCAAPACNPSRTALLTGVSPATSGVYHNSNEWRKSPVLEHALTLPQYLRKEGGYQVFGSGKIFHDNFADTVSWDYYWPTLDRQRPEDPKPNDKLRPLNGLTKPGEFDWGGISNSKEEMSDWQVSSWISEQLAKPYDKPFFMAFGLFRPHLPWFVPQKYLDMYPLSSITLPTVKDDDLQDVPEAGKKMARTSDHTNVLEHNQYKEAVQAYMASITFADECLGRVLDALDKSAYAKNTIIVLWSDHGWHLGEKHSWRKFTLWEEAGRSVLMVSTPGQKGQRCATPVNLLDIYPTLLELCGLPAKKECEGSSLLPLLVNPNAKWEKPSLTTHGLNNHSLRWKQWRYTRYADGSEELYNHQTDPMEWTNLANDVAWQHIKEQLRPWFPKVNAPETADHN